MKSQFHNMTSQSTLFDVAVFFFSNLITGLRFMSVSWLVLELWQFSFLKHWPEIRKSEISPSACNGTRTHNHLVRKWTLNHLAKLAKWLSCVVSIYLYDAFDMSRTHFRVNAHSIVAWMSMNFLLKAGAISEV